MEISIDEGDIDIDVEKDDFTDEESNYDESDDETLNDNESSDFEPVIESEIGQSQYKDCGGCGKDFNTKNTYKCKQCGIISLRSRWNTLFDRIKQPLLLWWLRP